jgi:hypothetical protein
MFLAFTSVANYLDRKLIATGSSIHNLKTVLQTTYDLDFKLLEKKSDLVSNGTNAYIIDDNEISTISIYPVSIEMKEMKTLIKKAFNGYLINETTDGVYLIIIQVKNIDNYNKIMNVFSLLGEESYYVKGEEREEKDEREGKYNENGNEEEDSDGEGEMEDEENGVEGSFIIEGNSLVGEDNGEIKIV